MGIFAGAIDYFQRGGACMWPLLLCSLAAIAIGVERYLYYKKALSSTDFVMEFCRLMNDFNIVGAREFAGMNKGDAAELATETLDTKILVKGWSRLFILRLTGPLMGWSRILII